MIPLTPASQLSQNRDPLTDSCVLCCPSLYTRIPNPGQDDPPCDDYLNLWVGFLLDARVPEKPSDSTGGTSAPSRGRKDINSAALGSPGASARVKRSPSPVRRPGTWTGPGGEGWMRAEVLVVNPSEVISADGIHRYPKGTFGIR